ncbi:AP-1 complex subunit sigma-3, partial [Lemmus lemmus]
FSRYASLYFCCAIENQDNELLTLEIVHRYVELLDKYFGNVCELDIIFNFEKAYFILDEFIIGGEIQETSKKTAVKAIEDSDMLQEVSIVFIPGKDDVDSSTNYNIATLITTPAYCAGRSFYFKQFSCISLRNSFSNSNQVSVCLLVSEQRLGR